MHFHFKRIVYVVLAAQLLPLLCGIIIVVSLQWVISNTEHSTKNEEKAREALKSCAEAQKNLLRAGYSMGVYTVSGLERDLDGYYKARPQLMKVGSQLTELETGFPNQLQTIEKMVTIADGFRNSGDQLVALHRLGRPFASLRVEELFQECQGVTEQWGELSSDLHKGITNDLKLSPVSRGSYMTTLSRILLFGLLGIFIACLLNARLLTTYIDRRLTIIRDNSAKLAKGEPLLPRLTGEDEMATLDKEFHSMSEAIAEASRREKQILESASDIILTLDQLLEVKSGNPATIRLWKDSNNLVGTPFLNLVPADSTGRLKRFFEHLKQTNTAGFIEIPLKSDVQGEAYTSVSAQWSAQNNLFSCVIHDITERKQVEDAVRRSEERLRAMLEQMPAGMLLCGHDGIIIGGNQMAALLLSWPEPAIAGTGLSTLLPLPEGEGSEISFLESVIAEGHVLMALTSTGQATHIDVTVQKVSWAGKDSYLIVMLDITANQNLELLRHQFIDGISENIVMPLNSISDVLTRLHSSTDSQTQQKLSKYLGTARQESDRLLKLFGDLLEVESSNLKHLSINKQDVSVQDLMERSLEAVRVTAEKKHISLSCRKTPIRLNADPDRIVQVLINLIFNALKFTADGGFVKLEADLLADGQIELRVMDNGCGIPAGMEDKIFEPFKQTKVSDQLAKGGSGLGLFICKTLVEKHGGTISAKNYLQGAIFSIKLPQNADQQLAISLTAKQSLETS